VARRQGREAREHCRRQGRAGKRNSPSLSNGNAGLGSYRARVGRQVMGPDRGEGRAGEDQRDIARSWGHHAKTPSTRRTSSINRSRCDDATDPRIIRCRVLGSSCVELERDRHDSPRLSRSASRTVVILLAHRGPTAQHRPLAGLLPPAWCRSRHGPSRTSGA